MRIKSWMAVHGTWDNGVVEDVPRPKPLTDRDEFLKYIEGMILDDVLNFYDGPCSDSWNGPVIEPHDDTVRLIKVIEKGEDTLFDKVEEARKQLLERIYDMIVGAGEWQHTVHWAGDEGSFTGLFLVEV